MSILNEVLEEQKKMQRARAETSAAIQKLTIKIDGIEEAEKTKAKTTTAFYVKPVQNLMNSNTTEIKLWIQAFIGNLIQIICGSSCNLMQKLGGLSFSGNDIFDLLVFALDQ